MRELSCYEFGQVSGGETDTNLMLDPVAAIQTFFLIAALTDKNGFVYGSVISGMTMGTAIGGYAGYYAAVGAGVALGVGGAIAGAGLGMIAGGLIGKAVASFGVGVYSTIMA